MIDEIIQRKASKFTIFLRNNMSSPLVPKAMIFDWKYVINFHPNSVCKGTQFESRLILWIFSNGTLRLQRNLKTFDYSRIKKGWEKSIKSRKEIDRGDDIWFSSFEVFLKQDIMFFFWSSCLDVGHFNHDRTKSWMQITECKN